MNLVETGVTVISKVLDDAANRPYEKFNGEALRRHEVYQAHHLQSDAMLKSRLIKEC